MEKNTKKILKLIIYKLIKKNYRISQIIRLPHFHFFCHFFWGVLAKKKIFEGRDCSLLPSTPSTQFLSLTILILLIPSISVSLYSLYVNKIPA